MITSIIRRDNLDIGRIGRIICRMNVFFFFSETMETNSQQLQLKSSIPIVLIFDTHYGIVYRSHIETLNGLNIYPKIILNQSALRSAYNSLIRGK